MLMCQSASKHRVSNIISALLCKGRRVSAEVSLYRAGRGMCVCEEGYYSLFKEVFLLVCVLDSLLGKKTETNRKNQ